MSVGKETKRGYACGKISLRNVQFNNNNITIRSCIFYYNHVYLTSRVLWHRHELAIVCIFAQVISGIMSVDARIASCITMTCGNYIPCIDLYEWRTLLVSYST